MLRVIEEHLGSDQVSRVIYGAIIGMALIVGLEHHPPAAGVVIGSLVATALAVAFAELYSDLVGTYTRTRAGLRGDHVRAVVRDVCAVAFGIAFPAIFFLLVALHVMELDTAFRWAKWSGLGLIAFYGFWAGRLSGGSLPHAFVHAVGVAVIGGALIAFKAVLH